MYIKGREHPIRVPERYSECKRETDPWRTMPFRMLRHKAFMQAARVAFSLGGLFDEDEARDVIDVQVTSAHTLPPGGNAEKVKRLVNAKQIVENQNFTPPAELPPVNPDTGEEGNANDAAQAETATDPVAETTTKSEPAPMTPLEQFIATLDETAEALGVDKAKAGQWWRGYLVTIGKKGKEATITGPQFADALKAFAEEHRKEKS